MDLMWWHTAICMSSLRESSALFWPLKALQAHGHRHRFMENTHSTYKWVNMF